MTRKYSHRAKGRGLAEIQIDLRRRGPPGPVYVFCVVGHAKQPAKIDRGPSRNLLGISVDCLKKSLFCMTVVKASGVKVDPTKDAACSENEIEEETEKPHHCCSDPSSSFSNEHVKGQPRIQLGFSRFEWLALIIMALATIWICGLPPSDPRDWFRWLFDMNGRWTMPVRAVLLFMAFLFFLIGNTSSRFSLKFDISSPTWVLGRCLMGGVKCRATHLSAFEVSVRLKQTVGGNTDGHNLERIWWTRACFGDRSPHGRFGFCVMRVSGDNIGPQPRRCEHGIRSQMLFEERRGSRVSQVVSCRCLHGEISLQGPNQGGPRSIVGSPSPSFHRVQDASQKWNGGKSFLGRSSRKQGGSSRGL